MDCIIQDQDLLDLLSEQHLLLKNVFEEKWNELSDIPISYSEWYVLSMVYKKRPTIAYVTKHVNITRQATHKLIKKLESKGLLEITPSNNRRDKSIQLTVLGESCFEKQLTLKSEIEATIARAIGESELKHLKDILQMDWGLNKS